MPGDRRYGAYSVFRAMDSRNVDQRPTPRPRIHDFPVIWDGDRDTPIVPVIEEMPMVGLLPGVQFLGGTKGGAIILVARTFLEHWC